MTALLIKSAEKTVQHVAFESAVKLAWFLEVILMFPSAILYLMFILPNNALENNASFPVYCCSSIFLF